MPVCIIFLYIQACPHMENANGSCPWACPRALAPGHALGGCASNSNGKTLSSPTG